MLLDFIHRFVMAENDGGEGKGAGGGETGVVVGLQQEPEVVVVLSEDKDGVTSREVSAEDAKVISERSAKAEDNRATVDAPDAEEAAELASAESDQKREEIRSRRREERQRKRDEARQREDQKDRRIAALENQVARVSQTQGEIADRDIRSTVSNIESHYEVSKAQFEEARSIRKKALKEQNDEAFDAADEAMRAAERQMDFLVTRRDAIIYSVERSQAQPVKLDPAVVANARIFGERNRHWFNPGGTDANSKIALAVDEEVKNLGLDPRSAAYWQEVEKRAQERLPHIKVGPQQTQGRDAKQITSGAGRETAAAGAEITYTLSAARVAALKEAGMWEDPKQRAKMINRYRQIDKQNSKVA